MLLKDLTDELKLAVEWQRVPVALTNEDFEKMVFKAIEWLFVDTGRSLYYKYDDIYDNSSGQIELKYNLALDEKKYVMILAQIQFFKKVQTDVNNLVSYTTDALTVTNTHRPYAQLQNTLDALENERRITFYKMIRYLMQ